MTENSIGNMVIVFIFKAKGFAFWTYFLYNSAKSYNLVNFCAEQGDGALSMNNLTV